MSLEAAKGQGIARLLSAFKISRDADQIVEISLCSSHGLRMRAGSFS